MRVYCSLAAAAHLILLAGCDSGGTTTREVRQAAIERARQEFQLPADAPLEASVWAGQPRDGETIVCGTVSGGGSAEFRPQRFAASTAPLEWLIFEDAHDAMVQADPDKFPEWSALCGTGS